MNRLLLKSLLGATCLSLAIVGTANAGGFSRGSADTDIIYEDGNFNMRSSVTYVSPRREFSSNPNPALNGTRYTEDYVVPSLAVKFNIVDDFRCGLTHVMNNGGSVKYDFPTASGKLLEEFTTYESAATCGYKFDVGKGRVWLIGGAFMEKLDYHRENYYGVFGDASLDLAGTEYGFRVGAAYEIPEIAFRAQGMYRSGTEYGADGMVIAPAAVLYGALASQGIPNAANPFAAIAAANPTAQVPVQAIGVGNLPESFEVKLQSGIAEDWLAFGAIKWTNWSKTTTLDVRSAIGNFPITVDEFYWKDGWTFTGGLAHKFNETVSGLASFTYDSGVSTGYDLTSDTYTFSAGALFKDKLGGELRIGGGLSYIASAEETKYGLNPNAFEPAFDQAVDSAWALAGSIGYAIKW
ncbi:MAG: outer membrane protein transport protein [Rhizobiaceae bacterium]|nr:outer membrane protein transport protein [Rhizobiaceae bacterium]